MAAHNSSSHTETSDSNTPPWTRVKRGVESFCKLRRIVFAFLLALSPIFPVEGEFLSDLEKLLTDRNRNFQKKIHTCESRCLRLKFSHEVAPLVYSGEGIFPNGTKLELVDDFTGQQVRHVPLASAQVEVFLLNGDENWTIEKLKNHIRIQKRGGKSGRDHNPYLRLKGGVISVNEIKFKYSPNHMKKLKQVRLGARIVNQPEETKVIEAVTGPFTVKDKRLKSKKRYPPSPTDDVWRLEHIYKNGAFHKRLTENGIKTVEDFLIELHYNPQRLHKILGKSMSKNYWEKATKHANTCNLDGRRYLYHHLETTGQKFTVAFNVTSQVMWLDSGCGLHRFNMLSEYQKEHAHNLVETAFANWKNVQKYDNEIPVADHLSPYPKLEGMSRSHPGNLNECYSSKFQNTLGTAERVDSTEFSASYAIADGQSEPDEMPIDIISPAHSEELWLLLNSDAIQLDDFSYANNTSATQFHESQHGEMTQNQFTQFMVSENVTNANENSQMNNVLMVPEASTTRKGKCKKSWTKIFSILKWFVKLKKVRMTKKRKLSST